MFLYTHRHGNLIIFPALVQTQALLFHDQLPVGWSYRLRHWSFMISYRWGGVGWGGAITFMFLCTHRHSNLIIFLAVLHAQALLFHDRLRVGWGGVRWGGTITCSCSRADTGTLEPTHLAAQQIKTPT